MGSAGEVVQAYVAAQVGRLLAAVPGVRAGDDDAVHDARVATRRLRAALSVYRPVLDREVADPLRDELAELGHVLGTPGTPTSSATRCGAGSRTRTRRSSSVPSSSGSTRTAPPRASLAQDRLDAWLASARFTALVATLAAGPADRPAGGAQGHHGPPPPRPPCVGPPRPRDGGRRGSVRRGGARRGDARGPQVGAARPVRQRGRRAGRGRPRPAQRERGRIACRRSSARSTTP